MMENRIEFLAVVIALNKIGITAGLINTNLLGRPLSHRVSVTESKKCVFLFIYIGELCRQHARQSRTARTRRERPLRGMVYPRRNASASRR